ncbi:MAG: nitroreductase [Candidatus Brocadiaceae bacterium]|nr:nitroreductase [Candidatus Brocadiaceae bacterium]
MDVFEAIELRRSVRAWADRPVEDEKVRRVLEAARLAPSARNLQEWKFVVVRDAELRRQLTEAANGQAFVGDAPVVIAACATSHDHVMSCGHPSFLVDLSIALEHIALAARAVGLGTCWVGAFSQDAVRRILGIPDSVQVVELMPLGYPAAWPGPRGRKAFDEVVCCDRWSD